VAGYLLRGVGRATWRFRARVTVHAPATAIADRLPPAVVIQPLDQRSCVVEVGSDTPQMLAVHLGMLGADFEVHDPPELVEQLGALADRYRRAISAPSFPDERPPEW
jgi:hypothetical protein